MSPLTILFFVAIYFLVLVLISVITSNKSNNKDFFIGGNKSPWFLVAFGMIGASLSGVTFISVPGWVQTSEFSYMQMVLGYFFGYLVVAHVLMPMYYRLNLTSIYTYLETRFGFFSYKTGAAFFLLSRTIGAAFRLFLVANVLQMLIFNNWNIPFWVTVMITILLIWIYTFKGGIKTIVWTDTLQTLFMLIAVGVTIWTIYSRLDMDFNELFGALKESNYTKIFFLEDWRDGRFFIKQFLSGMFITIVMTGLDQDMMQKNLSCKNINDAKKNMLSFSFVLIVVNFIFLVLGALLFFYASTLGIEVPKRTDNLYPLIATSHLNSITAIFFILGLVAAAYSSADSALTSLTTSVCIDFLNFEKRTDNKKTNHRKIVHVLVSVVLFFVILIFNIINDENVISALFKAAGYTYGPLLGMYAFGLFSKRKVIDKFVPIVCVISPIICYLLNTYSVELLNGYKFGFEILILNGLLTYLGLYLISSKNKKIT